MTLFVDLKVVQAYPCKCRIADTDDGLLVETQVILMPFDFTKQLIMFESRAFLGLLSGSLILLFL